MEPCGRNWHHRARIRPKGGGLAHGDKHISVMVVTAADWAPAPVPWMGTKAKEDSLGTLIWVGPHYWEGWRSLISLLRGRPGSCPRSAVTSALREVEGLERRCLSDKQNLTYRVVVSESGRVGGLSVWLICPLGSPAPGRTTLFGCCHPGHELAVLSRSGRGWSLPGSVLTSTTS